MESSLMRDHAPRTRGGSNQRRLRPKAGTLVQDVLSLQEIGTATSHRATRLPQVGRVAARRVFVIEKANALTVAGLPQRVEVGFSHPLNLSPWPVVVSGFGQNPRQRSDFCLKTPKQ